MSSIVNLDKIVRVFVIAVDFTLVISPKDPNRASRLTRSAID